MEPPSLPNPSSLVKQAPPVVSVAVFEERVKHIRTETNYDFIDALKMTPGEELALNIEYALPLWPSRFPLQPLPEKFLQLNPILFFEILFWLLLLLQAGKYFRAGSYATVFTFSQTPAVSFFEYSRISSWHMAILYTFGANFEEIQQFSDSAF